MTRLRKNSLWLLPLAAGVLALAACKQDAKPAGGGTQAASGKPAADGEHSGPPMVPPPYVMREPMPAGNRLATGRKPEAVYQHVCGYCHLPGGMGTNLLVKQRIAAGAPPETALLTNRTDLTADYIKQVVREGKNAMPPQTRVDITDPELDGVTKWLAKGK